MENVHTAIIEHAPVWINVLDLQARVLEWNHSAERISGYRREEVIGHGEIWQWLYPDPDYRAHIAEKLGAILLRGQGVNDFETRIRCKSGEEKIINWHSQPLFDSDGGLIGSSAIGQDVTMRRHAEAALEDREQQLTTLLANLPGMAYRCLHDRQWTMKFVSSGCLELTGYRPEELIDNRLVTFGALLHPDDAEAIWQATQAQVSTSFSYEYRIRHRDGHYLWVWERGSVVEYDGIPLLEGIILDVSDRKRMEQELKILASHDSLTGLLNRHELMKRMNHDISRASRYGQTLSILMLDVDHFKPINDNHGHQVGDHVLRQLGALLLENIREVDYAGRYGGEELLIVLPELDFTEACEMAERLRQLIEKEDHFPHDYDGEHRQVTVSIGIASFPQHGLDTLQMFNAADKAMYRAKENGRNRVQIAAQVSA
jgi:diguanylate cyclase (GGDEF)-like protein/PAS domain S-box-containing protein